MFFLKLLRVGLYKFSTPLELAKTLLTSLTHYVLLPGPAMILLLHAPKQLMKLIAFFMCHWETSQNQLLSKLCCSSLLCISCRYIECLISKDIPYFATSSISYFLQALHNFCEKIILYPPISSVFGLVVYTETPLGECEREAEDVLTLHTLLQATTHQPGSHSSFQSLLPSDQLSQVASVCYYIFY